MNFKELIISSPSQCIDVFKGFPAAEHVYGKLHLYHRHVVIKYFTDHHKKFQPEQIIEFFNNKTVSNKISREFLKNILTDCITNKSLYPLVITQWFQDGTKLDLLKKYLEIVNTQK